MADYVDMPYFAIAVLSAEDYYAPLRRQLEDGLHAALMNHKTLRAPVVQARPRRLVEHLIATACGSRPPKPSQIGSDET
jgi:hypothetical protein